MIRVLLILLALAGPAVAQVADPSAPQSPSGAISTQDNRATDLAILSFVFLFTEMFGQAMAGIGVGLVVSVPLAVAISALEIIVVLVQAYVFTLLSAVFIGMAINVHH